MANQITLGNVQIKCRFPVTKLQECCIYAKYGEHTKAEIVCTVKGSESRAALTDVDEDELKIVNRGEDGREETLFDGVIHDAEYVEEGRLATLKICAFSHTWKMDIRRKSRSFQNIHMTYADVAQAVLQEYDADMRWNISDRQLAHPLIQYQETDYSFLQRILSHLQCRITSEDTRDKICFYAGIRSGRNIGDIDLNKYVHSIIWSKRMGYEGYKITGTDFVRVGDVLQLQGRNYYVMEAATTFEHNVLYCRYSAFPEACFKSDKLSASTIQGHVLTGRVLKTEQEFVRLHLDIDKEQSVSDAYDFLWKPITGNLFYCMPEEGTKAALYFGEADESTGIVIMNIRENGDECGETADYNNRYFTTNNRKRMYLKPSEMGLLNIEEQNAEIALKDDSVLQVKTNHQISVLAEGQVELKGKNVNITTPKEATLVRKDMISPTVINLCNAFDAIGAKGNFAATAPISEKKRKPLVTGQQSEKYSLDGAVLPILSNIPLETEGNQAMEIVAGSMPVIIPET